MITQVIKTIVNRYPAVIPHLRGRARGLYLATLPNETKTYEFFRHQLERLIISVYDGYLGGEFETIVGDLLFGQFMQAYQMAWDEEGDGQPMPDYLVNGALEMYQEQMGYIEQLYRDIVDAQVDEMPIDPLLARSDLWANRYEQAYHDAIRLITVEMGGKLVWRLGATEEHCETCSALNGKVDWAVNWEAAGLHPQSAPNDMLECGGWRCDCSLEPTDERRTPNGLAGMGYNTGE